MLSKAGRVWNLCWKWKEDIEYKHFATTWTDGGYLLPICRFSDRMQGHSRKLKDTDAGLGSRLALYGTPSRRAMTEHWCSR
jgi:hypothetical protein